MKWLRAYDSLGLTNEEDVFGYLSGTFGEAIRTWDYFVNWAKVFNRVEELEVQLNIWNYLIGKQDFEMEFRKLLARYPEIVQALPALAVRDGKGSDIFRVITGPAGAVKKFDFSSPANNSESIDAALEFVLGTGLGRLFGDSGVKNLVDYLIGVEAGVDSNGRKNRSGTGMEFLLESAIASMCRERGWSYKSQATEAFIEETWGVKFSTGSSLRRFDFAVLAENHVSVIETNIYNGGGSKLKATAGEFSELQSSLGHSAVKLIWVTDGLGWRTALRPLRDAFGKVPFIFNMSMIERGCLEEALELPKTAEVS